MGIRELSVRYFLCWQSEGMCGAAYLSAAAALKCSAGMVKIQTVEAISVPLQTLLPEAMITCDFDESKNTENAGMV